MKLPWRYFIFLLWFSYLIVVSILLFTRGFLLNRVTQTFNATCLPYSANSCTANEFSEINNSVNHAVRCADKHESLMNYLHTASHICLPKRAKVVLIIIDALRYDFATYDPKNEDPLSFQNKLPVIHNLLKAQPFSTRLYKFIADPPTTTMQRLKALTTGSLPTFIDAGSNFATAEINEDNVIDQLVKQMQHIVFMGDDTWVSLYPKRFLRSYPFPSFNVFDLDTVDNGVIEHLYNELPQKDWSLLIGHFLGVDHCGHRYGPYHPEMARKLREMNKVVEDVIKELDKDTMLIVVGDHGMTITGDHGGESVDEVTAAMFVYSKSNLSDTEPHIVNDTIKQVDLVPTIATILGIPIPYSNLGSIIVNSLPVKNESFSSSEWQAVLFAVWSNVQQMTDYIREYSATSEVFNANKLQVLQEKFSLLNAKVRTVSSKQDFDVFVEKAKEYMKSLREMCEEVWIQFDSFSMSRGLLLIFLSIFLIYMIVSGIPRHQLSEILMSSFLLCSLIAISVAFFVSAACLYFELVDNLLATVFFSTGLASVFMLTVLIIQNWDVIAIHWYNLSKIQTKSNLISRLVFLLSCCGLLSNSYIVEEGYVSFFLLVTVLFLIVYERKQQEITKKTNSANSSKAKWNWIKVELIGMVFVVAVLIRLSFGFWRCREEQQWCITVGNAHARIIKPGASGKAEYLMTLVIVAVFVTATRNWLRSCGSLTGFSPSIILLRYTPTVMVVATGGYWVLQGLPKNEKLGWQPNYLAWIVYGFVTLGILSIIFKPLYVYIIPQKKKLQHYGEGDVIPQLFNSVKGLFNEKNDSDIPIVCGLATSYSATYVALSIYISLLIILLLGEVLSTSIVILYFTSAATLAISAISKYEKATDIAHLFEVSNVGIQAWMLLSLYFFYGSGHQATFSNIAWEAAFIGTSGTFTNNIIPAALVIINTFGSHIIMGITLPLLFIVPFTLPVTVSSLYTKKSSFWKELCHGEVLLYENDSVMMSGVFILCCKYILLHAVRVFVSMLSATIHCRHLMVWKIFAPKFIFEAIGMFVTLAAVLLGYLLLMYVNYKMNILVSKLNKRSR